jgi:hypothetical protein
VKNKPPPPAVQDGETKKQPLQPVFDKKAIDDILKLGEIGKLPSDLPRYERHALNAALIAANAKYGHPLGRKILNHMMKFKTYMEGDPSEALSEILEQKSVPEVAANLAEMGAPAELDVAELAAEAGRGGALAFGEAAETGPLGSLAAGALTAAAIGFTGYNYYKTSHEEEELADKDQELAKTIEADLLGRYSDPSNIGSDRKIFAQTSKLLDKRLAAKEKQAELDQPFQRQRFMNIQSKRTFFA